MTNNRLYLPESTASLLEKGATAFILPFPKDSQPKKHWKYMGMINGEARFFNESASSPMGMCNGYDHYYKPPAKEGYPLYICETWAYRKFGSCTIYDEFIYKADYDKGELYLLELQGVIWRSPTTMPNAACRHIYKCKSIKATQKDGVWGWEIELGR